jgi:DNA-binding transcriptional LysR family regulator
MHGRSRPAAQTAPAADATGLLTLLAVAEAGSERAAARVLGISQSAVSRRLAALQAGSPARLTRHAAGGTRLTPQGAALLPHARALRAALEGAGETLARPEATPLPVRIGLSHHLVPRLSGALLREARRLADQGAPVAPALQEGYSRPLLDAVREGALDAAVTLATPAAPEPGLRLERLGHDQLCLLTLSDDPVAREGQVDPAALQGETLLLPSGASSMNARVRAEMRHAGLEPGRVLELSGPAAVRAAVLAGQGIGVSVWSYVQLEAAAGWMARVGVEPGEDRVDVWLASSERLDPATDAVATRLLRNAMAATAR